MARIGTRMLLLALVALAVFAGMAGGARAAFSDATASGQQQVGTIRLVAPASATATTTTACSTIDVAWAAVTGASAYRIEISLNGGAWAAVTTVGSVTSYADATGRTNAGVAYRVYARHASSGWESTAAATTAQLACGIVPVSTLAASNPCSSSVVTWSAPAGAGNYDVQRRVNGGAWSPVATDITTTTHTDTTAHPAGATVEYQVRSGSGALNGSWSASATFSNFQVFRVVSVTATNAATLGALEAGDTLVVAFSKPVTTASVVPSLTTDIAGGNRGLYLGVTAAGTGGVGRLLTPATTFGTETTLSGAGSWSNANATWTWTSAGGGTTMTAPLANDAWTPGTGVRCAADGSPLAAGAAAPTASGRW